MPEVGIASVSRSAAEAGAEVADRGGNAVDAAIAASLAAVVTHPGMCSLGGGGFLTIRPPGGPAVTVDGGMAMPGRGAPGDRFGRGGIPVHLEYGGGVDTVVGPGSVATPGLLAACALASERYGRLPWRRLVEPAADLARKGFPLPAPSHRYLVHSHDLIFGRDPRSRAALHRPDGRLKDPGESVRVEHLADTLEAIAEEGAPAFYEGELGRRIADHLQEEGGLLTPEDLLRYRAVVRRPLTTAVDGWRVATNPPPAVGGATLTAMLRLMEDRPRGRWSADDLRHLVRVQEAVLGYRLRNLDGSEDRETAVRRLLEEALEGELRRRVASASTLHTSTVDSDGLACSATFSDGYGSGIVPPGTGIWLNNCLGEAELNPGGFHSLLPGRRLASNMAPTVATKEDGGALAIGSPGADRITTAILQVLLAFLRLGATLEEAVRHPRLHVEWVEEASGGAPAGRNEGAARRRAPRIAVEPGLPVEEAGTGLPVRRFEGADMFFGGVAAALRDADGTFHLAADPRRTGGTASGGERT